MFSRLTRILRKKSLNIIEFFLKGLIFFLGSRPESSEGEAPAFNGGQQPLLLDPLAINLMPPEFEKPVSKSYPVQQQQHRVETQKLHNGIRHLQLVEPDINFNGFTKNFAPKGSLV